MIKKRYLEKPIIEDLRDKMVFIAGPRQVGKTTLAVSLGDKFYSNGYIYLNWDSKEDRRMILNSEFRADKDLIIFDEIHKYRTWKNYLKGEFDKYKDRFRMLVTGSARLDIYKKGGDSLLGRYYYYRLHPFSLNEILNKSVNIEVFKELEFLESKKEIRNSFDSLLKFGGFPEPFIKQSDKALRRWHNQRMDRVVKEDIRDIESIRDLSALQVLVEILPDRVGSLLSLNSLREDLNVAHKTMSLWVDILERFYYHFRIYPFQSNRIKSLRKEPKMYLWDWSELTVEAKKFENIIASQLLKFCHYLIDSQGIKAELYYLRDIEKREVDFVIIVDKKPWFCVEAKVSSREIPSALRYFKERLKIPFSYQVVRDEGIDFLKDNVRVISASKFLTAFV